MNTLDKMFEYNLWANTALLELCMGLTEEQMAVVVDGVYGGIHPTLAHIVNAEGGYLRRLTGSRPWPDDLDLALLPLEELLTLAKRSGQQLIDVASHVDPDQDHTITAPWGKPFTFSNWVVVSQAFYHGVEHRTQVKVLLTKLGIEHGDFSLWSYVETFPFNEQ